MRIYIAGKITGLRYEEVAPKFEKAEQELRAAGWEPVNPMKLGIPFDSTRENALKVCIPALKTCKAIYMLEDWQDSIGSIVEHGIAKHEEMDRYYAEWQPIEHMRKLISEVL